MEHFNDPMHSSDQQNNTAEASVPSAESAERVGEPDASAAEREGGEHHGHHHSRHHGDHGHHHGSHHSSHHGHHKHHHHHRHHRRRRHHSGDHKKENKLVLFFKRNRSVLVNVLACTLALVMLILYATDRDSVKHGNIPSGSGTLPTATVRIDSSFYTEDIALASQAVLDYMNPELSLTADAAWKNYRNYLVRMDAGLPLSYSYRVSGLPEGISVVGAEMLISTTRTCADAKSYSFDDGADTVKIYNLLPNTQYYYQVQLTLSNGSSVGTLGQFRTVSSPRMLNVEGAVNVRDIGGWMTASGKIIPYGLLYRGSEIDGHVVPTYRITDAGMMEMLTNLGVRTDIDLRYSEANAPHTNALGENVKYLYYPGAMYNGIFGDATKETTRAIFAALADQSNYPIYLHCTYGRDRTGTVCYILEALLGVSREDLRREYELSIFASGYLATEDYVAFVTRFEMLEGATYADKAEGYLLSIGVTQAEIDSIRAIFLGE